MTITTKIRSYLRDNFLFGNDEEIADGDSLLERGVIDSTGAMELVGFLETEFTVTVSDRDLVPGNLDSIAAMTAFVERKLADAAKVRAAPATADS